MVFYEKNQNKKINIKFNEFVNNKVNLDEVNEFVNTKVNLDEVMRTIHYVPLLDSEISPLVRVYLDSAFSMVLDLYFCV